MKPLWGIFHYYQDMKNYKYIPKRFYSLILEEMGKQDFHPAIEESFRKNKRIECRHLLSAFCWVDSTQGFDPWSLARSGNFSQLEKYLEL